MDQIRTCGNGDQSFPTIAHELSQAHGIELGSDDNLRLDRLPTKRLLPAAQRDFDRIKVVSVAFLMLWREIRKVGSATAGQ